ncbi:MAG: hypothetical protein ABIB93_03335 [Chloroflexota bacterium]
MARNRRLIIILAVIGVAFLVTGIIGLALVNRPRLSTEMVEVAVKTKLASMKLDTRSIDSVTDYQGYYSGKGVWVGTATVTVTYTYHTPRSLDQIFGHIPSTPSTELPVTDSETVTWYYNERTQLLEMVR